MTARANVAQKIQIKKLQPTESQDSIGVDSSEATQNYDKDRAKSMISSMIAKNKEETKNA